MKVLRSYWPSALVLALILYATLWPDTPDMGDLPKIPYFDKLIHAIMFGGFAGAMAFDYCRAHKILRPSIILMALIALISTAAGGLIELIQDAMGLGRAAEWADLSADGIGAFIAFLTAPPAIAAVLRRQKG